MDFVIRPYEERDERDWLTCRLLSIFDREQYTRVDDSREAPLASLEKGFEHA